MKLRILARLYNPTARHGNFFLKECLPIWSGLEKQWLDNLSGAEREKFERLTTDSESAAFRIIRSYATKAQQDGAPDFPIARDNLGKRLGITGRGAGLLRQKFVDLAIIERTAPYKPNVAAARYRWTARF